ncbi:MAG: hypothetical protein H6737_19170 [Alphaproteobacteria bacterium]|nr:hypothetical protein [Alphaproteobacteria bacterium]
MTMDLKAHIHGPGTIGEIAAYLENLPPAQRWAAIDGLNKKDQRTLFLKAEASDPLTLDDFLPPECPVGKATRHAGKNSLPLFRLFEKPMARTGDGTIFGYNHQSMQGLIGPGYFVLREAQGEEIARGAVVVDYHQTPEPQRSELPDGWPPVKPNWSGLQYFVYHNTRDYMRRVAPGITIGSAWKTMFGSEKSLNSYFLLMRQGS